MSGHSHWSTIQRQKGANDAKRGQSFTKIANIISLAARLGGSGDPDTNPRLRMTLEEARSINMPKENIQRAIDRGLGKLPGQTLEEVVYEGYGPCKIAFYLEAVTDNKMRTLQEIRNLFDRSGGALGGNGSTAYMFDKKGEIKITSKGGDKDMEMLELIDLGADDVEDFEEGGAQKFFVYTDPTKLFETSTNITQSGYTVESSQIVFKPNMLTELTDAEEAKKVIEFAGKLEDHQDIQKVYMNAEVSDQIANSLQ